MHVLVLGAGLAGLAAADELARRGARVTVLEKERRVGGLASSLRVGPWWLDHGPHRFWSKDQELVAHLMELLEGEIVVRRRRSRIHLRERYFDYPLRAGNVLRNLPPGLLARAGWDWLRVRAADRLRELPEDNFEQWVVRRFGRTLYELFFGVYTEKAWGMPPSQISAEWAAQRISQQGLLQAARQALRPPRDGEARGLAYEFYYPRTGGIGSIASAYARRIERNGGEVRLGTRVTAIEHAGGRVVAVRTRDSNGEKRWPTTQVLNTLPLPLAVQALEPKADPRLFEAGSKLEFISILFVYLEIDRPSVTPDHWIYLPEAHLRVHRISEPKNFSDAALPGDKSVLCCEITCRAGDETWRLRREEAARIAAEDLERCGLIEGGQARPLAIARARHAYPVYDLGYRERLRPLRDAARAIQGFVTTGRQGLFRYNNMDHSMAMGRKAARTLWSGAEDGEAAEAVATSAEYFG